MPANSDLLVYFLVSYILSAPGYQIGVFCLTLDDFTVNVSNC